MGSFSKNLGKVSNIFKKRSSKNKGVRGPGTGLDSVSQSSLVSSVSVGHFDLRNSGNNDNNNRPSGSLRNVNNNNERGFYVNSHKNQSFQSIREIE